MEVTVKRAGSDQALSIRTDDNEITVSFDMWHGHFGAFLGVSEAEAFELALAEIRSFVTEESVVAVVYRDGKWEGSRSEDADAAIAPKPGVVTNVYSWSGTYDRTV